MPAPVVLRAQFAQTGAPIRALQNSTMVDDLTAIVTWPVDVWFGGSRTFSATLDFGGRAIEKITLDPFGRVPDRNATDSVRLRRRRRTARPAERPGEPGPHVGTASPAGFMPSVPSV